MGPVLSVHLREMSVLKESNKRKRKAGTNCRCPFYRGVHLTEVSVKRESTVNSFRMPYFVASDELTLATFMFEPETFLP